MEYYMKKTTVRKTTNQVKNRVILGFNPVSRVVKSKKAYSHKSYKIHNY